MMDSGMQFVSVLKADSSVMAPNKVSAPFLFRTAIIAVTVSLEDRCNA